MMNLHNNLLIQNQILQNLNLSLCCNEFWVLDKINSTISTLKKKSKYFRDREDVNNIMKIEEIANLPFMTKKDFEINYPFGLLTVSKTKLVRYAESTGTTGQISSGYVTLHDWLENNILLYLGWSQILEPSDKIIVAVPYVLSYVGSDIDRVCELIGATVISAGALSDACNWEKVLQLMHKLQATSIICSPSRVLRLAEMIEDMNLNPKTDLSIRKIFCVGEVLTSEKKRRIEEKWNAKVFVTYGMTETTSLASPCAEAKLHLCDYRYYFEVVNPETHKQVKDGEKGELVVTSLSNEALPLLRFRTGDLVVKHNKNCNCKLPFSYIHHFGRIKNFIQIKNQCIAYYDLENWLLSLHIDHYFQVNWNHDKLIISISPLENQTNYSDLILYIQSEFNEKFGFEPIINMVTKKDFQKEFDTSLKPGTIFFKYLN